MNTLSALLVAASILMAAVAVEFTGRNSRASGTWLDAMVAGSAFVIAALFFACAVMRHAP